MLKRLTWILVLTLVTAIAGAQDFYHRPSFLAGRTILTLALFEEVRTELKTTDDINKKEDALLEKMSGEVGEAFQSASGDLKAMMAEVNKINAKYDDETLKLLTADQVTRIKQLFVQYNGALAVSQTAIGKDVSVTEEQSKKMADARQSNSQKIFELFSSGQPDPKELTKLQDELKADIEKILTDDQKKKLKEMEGTKFEFKKITAGGGR